MIYSWVGGWIGECGCVCARARTHIHLPSSYSYNQHVICFKCVSGWVDVCVYGWVGGYVGGSWSLFINILVSFSYVIRSLFLLILVLVSLHVYLGLFSHSCVPAHPCESPKNPVATWEPFQMYKKNQGKLKRLSITQQDNRSISNSPKQNSFYSF